MATITLRSVKGSPLTNNEVDSNFTNLNNDKYESGDNVNVGNVVATGDLSVSGETTFSASAVTAAGSNINDATTLSDSFNVVTGGTANQGVILPDAVTGKVVTVINNTSASVNIKVYPQSADEINSAGVGVAKDLSPGAKLQCVAISGTEWVTIDDIIVYDSSGSRIN
jgi:hypothetical protein